MVFKLLYYEIKIRNIVTDEDISYKKKKKNKKK